MMHTPIDPPLNIILKTASRILRVEYSDDVVFDMPFEYLRVHSPSAEVMGHGPGQEILQVDKEDVTISRIDPVGLYAIRLVFDDGHDTGLYTWNYLRELGEQYTVRWAAYLDRLKAAGYPRTSN